MERARVALFGIQIEGCLLDIQWRTGGLGDRKIISRPLDIILSRVFVPAAGVLLSFLLRELFDLRGY